MKFEKYYLSGSFGNSNILLINKQMNRAFYEAPETVVQEVKIESCIMSVSNATRSSYGTASKDDGTEQEWD